MSMLPLRSAALAALLFAGAAAAQYPNKPIRMIVPFPPGGTADIAARIVLQPMAQALGQTIVVDNRPGADGGIAGDIVAKAPPNGYTLFFATATAMSALPALRKNPPYDPITQFTPISSIGRFVLFVVVHPSVPANTIAELIDYLRANPGKLEYGTGQTTSMLAIAQFMKWTNTQMLHVPYKGDSPAITDLVAGRIRVMFPTQPGVIAHSQAGRLRVLATLLQARTPLLPDVPTMTEVGMPEFPVASWAGMYGPAGLPREVVEIVSRELNASLKRPEVIEGLGRQGIVPVGSTPEEFAIFTKDQLVSWGKALREAGVQPD